MTRGDIYDRCAALERQVESLLQQVSAIKTQTATPAQRWPALGIVPDEEEVEGEGGIEDDEFGEIQLINQFNDGEIGIVKAKNKTGKKIPEEALCLIHLINGVLVITAFFTPSDCQSLSQAIQDIDGYDAAEEQALIHLAESEEGEDDGCLSWMDIDECPPPEE